MFKKFLYAFVGLICSGGVLAAPAESIGIEGSSLASVPRVIHKTHRAQFSYFQGDLPLNPCKTFIVGPEDFKALSRGDIAAFVKTDGFKALAQAISAGKKTSILFKCPGDQSFLCEVRPAVAHAKGPKNIAVTEVIIYGMQKTVPSFVLEIVKKSTEQGSFSLAAKIAGAVGAVAVGGALVAAGMSASTTEVLVNPIPAPEVRRSVDPEVGPEELAKRRAIKELLLKTPFIHFIRTTCDLSHGLPMRATHLMLKHICEDYSPKNPDQNYLFKADRKLNPKEASAFLIDPLKPSSIDFLSKLEQDFAEAQRVDRSVDNHCVKNRTTAIGLFIQKLLQLKETDLVEFHKIVCLSMPKVYGLLNSEIPLLNFVYRPDKSRYWTNRYSPDRPPYVAKYLDYFGKILYFTGVKNVVFIGTYDFSREVVLFRGLHLLE